MENADPCDRRAAAEVVRAKEYGADDDDDHHDGRRRNHHGDEGAEHELLSRYAEDFFHRLRPPRGVRDEKGEELFAFALLFINCCCCCVHDAFTELRLV